MAGNNPDTGVSSGETATAERDPGPGKSSRKVHPMVRWNYVPRTVGFFLIGLILISLNYDSKNPLIWMLILALALGWPQAAYLISRASGDPVRSEYRHMCVEALCAGCVIVVIAFRPWPSIAMTIGVLVNTLGTGGMRLALRAALAYFCSMGFTLLLVGFTFIPQVSGATLLASILFILLYAAIVAYMSHSFMVRLRESRHSLRKAHQEIEDKLAASRREVGKREQVEQKLRAATLRAEAASLAKSRFLANMSHEIRTPMNAIIGMTELALAAKKDAEKDDHLATVKDATRHLLAVVNDILDFARVEAGKLRIENRDFDLPGLVGSICKTMHFHLDKKALDLCREIAGDVPHYVLGDASRLRQVLLNIIGNALKFTDKGQVTVKIERWAGEETDANGSADIFWLLFAVEDTGIGIPPEQLETVFESFHQVERDNQKLYGGTGLGLPICKKIIELMGGRIWAENPEGGGSRFCFVLPLQPGAAVAVDDTVVPRNWPEKTGGKALRILLAEDNPINIRLTCVVLDNLGHHSEVAENGVVAMEKLCSGSYDAVLMDLEMPVMDGFEATRRIRAGEAGQQNGQLPVVAMTAHVLDEVIEQCKQAGLSGYVSKPIDIARLSKVLQDVTSGGDGFDYLAGTNSCCDSPIR